MSRSRLRRPRSRPRALLPGVAGLVLLLAGCTGAQAGEAVRFEGPARAHLADFHARFHELGSRIDAANDANVEVQQAVYDTFEKDPDADVEAAAVTRRLETFRAAAGERDALLAELEVHPALLDPEVVPGWIALAEAAAGSAAFNDSYVEGFALFRKSLVACGDLASQLEVILSAGGPRQLRQLLADERAAMADCRPLLEELAGSQNPMHRSWGTKYQRMLDRRAALFTRAAQGRLDTGELFLELAEAERIVVVDRYLPPAVIKRMEALSAVDEFRELDEVLKEKAPLDSSDDGQDGDGGPPPEGGATRGPADGRSEDPA